ncbi:MAG: hypothetical protein EBT80_09240, partial [Chitinophagales bacterium]|nr:hypothetical protein [Chitinophagales bacterium]
MFLQTATPRSLDALIEKQQINWQEVALLSRIHRIRPVVFRVVMESIAPASIKEQLKRELQRITLQNFSIATETERLISLLEKNSISAIPYKGVAYSKQFYDDISMRESSDIDLVIAADDLPKTFALFEKEGYHAPNTSLYKRIGHKRYTTQEKDLCFDKTDSAGNRFHVELHYMITHPRFGAPATANRFDLSTTVASELNKGNARFLLPAEHFRAITLHHLLHDGLEYLKIFVDLAVGVKKISGLHQPVTDVHHLPFTDGHHPADTDSHHPQATSNQPLKNQHSVFSLGSLHATYRTNVLFIIMNNMLGIGEAAIENKTLEEEQLAARFIHFNLNSTIGRYKRHKVLSLLNHYNRTIRNRAALIRDPINRRKFALTYWINLFMPQQADEEALPLPRWLKP